MFKLHNYTFLKPIIPRRIQVLIRRRLVYHKLSRYKHVWPTDPESAKPPDGWTGWPGGKEFSLVLTHDVETEKGLEKCPELMKIEERMGFRSSFNFVAGDYEVPMEFINEIKNRGFEVGVHGLHHNDNIYKSKKTFLARAVKINQYSKKWGAVGFRTPSMHHNLDHIHDLNIEYDSSTFDTDPFEPQPDGVGTIFPFWVPGSPGQKGYVELPYTLPQDFLLFILMEERNINIWKTKLDWIAKHGGMALFITHPDYMNFHEGTLHYEEYLSQYYEEFLSYIKTRYAGLYWHALPKDVARFWAENFSHKEKINGNRIHACMLTYSFYETDNRVIRYAEALAKRGDSVDIIALGKEGAPPYENIRGVNVYRIQIRRMDEKGKMSYLLKLIKFLINSSIFLSKKHLQDPYELIHVHSVPDFEVFATLLPKLQGAKIILDIHDIVPEFYASKFNESKDSVLFKTLVKLERLSIKFSDHVIISNHLWEKTLLSRSVEENKCTVIMNYPDESVFYKRPRNRNDNKIIMLYHGTLGWHQGLDIAVKAFAMIKNQIPEAEFHIYGRGAEKNNLEHLIAELDLKNKVFIKDPIPIEQIADVAANADLGIIPKRNDPFGGEAFSTKTLEFMSLGIPVLVSETKIDKFYFDDSVVKFFKPDDVNDFVQCVLLLIRDKELRDRLSENALRFIENYRWEKKKYKYLDMVDSLIKSNRKVEQ